MKTPESTGLIIVGGPTGSGKTKFAIHLAKVINGELINADSRQIYKLLNIGTNKGNLEYINKQATIDGIPIHIIDFLDLEKRFSVFEWREEALSKIEDIEVRGKVPILVGGTGLYIDSLIKNYNYSSKFKLNAKQFETLVSLDIDNLILIQQTLAHRFPEIWNSLNYSDQNNLRRLQRLIEKHANNDKNLANTSSKVISDYLFYYPRYDLESLKVRLGDRVDRMFAEGLVDETMKVLKMGFDGKTIALQIMGYKQVIRYLNREISIEETIKLVKIAHNQYAKKQRTWFEGEGRGYKLKLIDFKNGKS